MGARGEVRMGHGKEGASVLVLMQHLFFNFLKKVLFVYSFKTQRERPREKQASIPRPRGHALGRRQRLNHWARWGPLLSSI